MSIRTKPQKQLQFGITFIIIIIIIITINIIIIIISMTYIMEFLTKVAKVWNDLSDDIKLLSL